MAAPTRSDTPHRDVSAIVTHRRYAALGETAQAVYLELLARAAPSGRVDVAVVRAAIEGRRFGRAAFDELADARLAAIADDAPDALQLVEPRALDQADALDDALDAGEGLPGMDPALVRELWRADARRALAIVDRRGQLAAMNAQRWAVLMDALGARRVERGQSDAGERG